ncbi:NepR family anti-sigma factor [Pararhodobacter sp.]|uniref:NepR family anti-sigma factor n=1 Tax=Pararhodobacter sp. TaxID=2127056 RepID=UPI002AFEC360|nr:NepR family anti-sigma factor [Pararhodobacter sp.]
MNTNKEQETPHKGLIREQLRRSFEDKASEELPADLMALIEKLKEQDSRNGK